jgi:CheY-like chemotaxis protein
MSKGPRIGWMIDNFLGDDVLKAVRDTWPVVMLRRSDEAGGLKDLRALLLLVEQPRFEGIATIARVRELSPSLPIIALSRGLDVNHAVELLRLGVADCMEHPWEPTVILRKIDRAMSGAASMSFTSPLLTPFAQRAGRPDHGVNRRRCFRAPIHASHGVASRIQFADLDRVCALTELGVPSEGGTGGSPSTCSVTACRSPASCGASPPCARIPPRRPSGWSTSPPRTTRWSSSTSGSRPSAPTACRPGSPAAGP